MIKMLALFTDEKGKYSELPQTTAFLNEKQIIPVIGESIAIAGKDHLLFKTEASDSKNIRKVSKRYLNYPDCDIAILLNDFSYS